MKRIFYLLVLALLPFATFSAGPDTQYVAIYTLIQQGDSLHQSGQYRAAAGKYAEAHSALRKLHSVYPNWNDRVVKFRLNYLSERLTALAQFVPPQTAPAAPESVARGTAEQRGPAAAPSFTPAAPAARTAESRELEDQIQRLNRSIDQLRAENASLQGKLREALSVQSEPADPAELSRAGERIRSLEKERDLLRVALDQEQSRATELAETDAAKPSRRDARATKRLEQERDDLQKKFDKAIRDLTALEARRAGEFQSSRAELARIELQRDEFQRKLEAAERQLAETASRGENETQSARAENRRLKNERDDLEKKLAAANGRISSLEKAATEVSRTGPSDLAGVQAIERQRDDLQAQLAAAHRQIAELEQSRSGAVASQAGARELGEARSEVERLRARVAALEARPTPFTPEELALFKAPEPKAGPALADTGSSSPHLPPGAGRLVAEAERAFSSGRLAEAEQKFTEVLRQDERNVHTLGNLAAIQIEMGRLDEAERNLGRALEVNPADGFSLALLGVIKFHQENYSEAMDALSRAAQLDPNNAETQNYLGITLGQLGHRVPAEAALRKAVQLRPGYASAHHNLAIIYATQAPPFIELAQWHYQRAVELGHSKNGDLEKLFAGK